MGTVATRPRASFALRSFPRQSTLQPRVLFQRLHQLLQPANPLAASKKRTETGQAQMKIVDIPLLFMFIMYISFVGYIIIIHNIYIYVSFLLGHLGRLRVAHAL